VRVCKARGQVLVQSAQEFELNFKKAIKLSPTADEVYEINVAQAKMSSGEFSLKAKVTDSDSVYKVKVRSNQVQFKAE
jgi:hypothetical protein